MGQERPRPEEIVAKLRRVDVLASQGRSVAEAVRSIGVTQFTCHRWRKEFGGLKTGQVERLKEREKEDERLGKGHLLIEEMLDSIIRTFVFPPDHLDDARLGFAQKLHVARSISLDEHNNAMWQIATRLNTPRNELAHSLDSPRRAGKIQSVLDAYFAEAKEDEHIALIKN